MFALRAFGHYVVFIAEISPGIEDMEVLEIARKEQALLLTSDKDFGELVFRNRETHSGILLIRSLDEADENATNTVTAIKQYGPDLLNRFSVLMGRTLRIRNVP